MNDDVNDGVSISISLHLHFENRFFKQFSYPSDTIKSLQGHSDSVYISNACSNLPLTLASLNLYRVFRS